MESVFDTLGKFKFWSKDESSLLNFTSNCTKKVELIRKKGSVSLRKTYGISKNALVELDENNNGVKYTCLDFKLLEPFMEVAGNISVFGFKLGTKDFFVDSSLILDNIIEEFRGSCILTEFEEDFAIIKQLGMGSTSQVYLVQELLTCRDFAAKCITKKKLTEVPNLFRNLIQEIKVLRQVEHPSIVKLFYVYETQYCIYLILEYSPYGDLYKRILQKKTFSEKDSISFAKNLLEVLEYLHSKSIVHRDIKLENIIMSSENDYAFKLIDFGLSFFNDQHGCEKCGSPGYIAPEVLEGIPYNHKIDVFGAGVLVYITLTGNHPFNASNSEKILNNNLKCSYKPEALKGLARDFVTKMLVKDPEERLDIWQLLDHPWFYGCRRSSVCTLLASSSTGLGSLYLNS